MEGFSIKIEAELYKDITEYCKANGLKINKFCNELLKKAFMVEKYGDIPFGTFEKVEDEPKKEEIEPKEVVSEPIAPKSEPIIPQNEPIQVEEVNKEVVEAPVKPTPKPRKRVLN